MKRLFLLLAAVVLLCGCAAQKAAPLPEAQKEISSEQLAAQLWLKLSDLPQPQPLTDEMTARLLELKEADLAQAVALFDPADPCGAQLFLLRAAPNKGEKLQTALQNRLELIKQTAAAILGDAADSQEVGCVATVEEWYALLVPFDMDSERTQQACQTLLAAFE